MRMRHRRVERCLLRAAVALDGGEIDEARELCSEVERLEPHNPDLSHLVARLTSSRAAPVIAESPAGAATPNEVVGQPIPVVVKPPIPVAVKPPIPVAVKPFPVAARPTAVAAKTAPSVVQPIVVAAEPAAVVAEPIGLAAEPHPDVVIDDAPRSSRLWVAAAALLILASGGAGWFWAHTRTSAAREPAVPTTAPQEATGVEPATPQAQSESIRVAQTTVTVAPAQSPPAEATPVVDNPPVPTSGASVSAPAPPARDERAERLRVDPAEKLTPVPPPPRTAPASEAPARAEVTAPVASPPAPDALPVVRVPEPSIAEPPAPSPATNTENVRLVGTAVDLKPTALPVPPAAAAEPSPARTTVADEKAIRAVLGRYEAAYNRLDAAAAAAVWPSADRRGLSHAFEGLASQSVSLGSCEVRVGTGSAQATCTGTHRWAPKVGGGAKTSARRWQFDLRNTSGDWIISQVSVR
jgi:hypothetical protein